LNSLRRISTEYKAIAERVSVYLKYCRYQNPTAREIYVLATLDINLRWE